MVRCTGKVPQRVNAWNRHMHREHGAYSNPTCVLCASFVWHTFDESFSLCRARMERSNTPTNAAVTTLAV